MDYKCRYEVLQDDGTWKRVTKEEAREIAENRERESIDVKFFQHDADFVKNEVTVYITEKLKDTKNTFKDIKANL